MAAAHHRTSNLCGIFDYNGLQGEGPVSKVMEFEPIAAKFLAFGWAVVDINGHDHRAILDAFERAEAERTRPTLIIARTIKGKGVSFMEGQACWHGSCAPSDEQLAQACRELEA